MKDLSMIVEVLESVDLNDNPEYHQPPSTGSSVDPGGYPRAIMKYVCRAALFPIRTINPILRL
jgi:hypothetical protein